MNRLAPPVALNAEPALTARTRRVRTLLSLARLWIAACASTGHKWDQQALAELRAGETTPSQAG